MGLRRSAKALVRKGMTVFAGKYLESKESSPSHRIQEPLRKDSELERTTTCNDAQNRASNRIVGLGFFCILLVVIVSAITSFSGSDSPQCRSIYMYPSYARIDGFDERYTKLAKKYHLYLYREQNKDRDPSEDGMIHVDGIPVLFIPGNAGSFKQARSIAAACANVYFDEPDSIENPHTKNLDFFTADFNEDFTAFHGRTLLDQAGYLNDAVSYILSLYRSQDREFGPPPQSVIILGHSMGGIVARVMPTLKNFRPESVNSYITLSAPHAAAPVTFDGDMMKIYERIGQFWTSQFEDPTSFFSQNISLISITGGVLDTVLPADFTTIEGIVPYENGFTTYTTTIPKLWTPIDHLAIVWCDQLRNVLAHMLLESVDVRSASKTRSLNERMHLYRKWLLTGLESYTDQDKKVNPAPMDLSYIFQTPKNYKRVSINEQDVLVPADLSSDPLTRIFTIPKAPKNLQFSILTSMQSVEVLFCIRQPHYKDQKLVSEDETSNCVPASEDFVTIPRSTSKSHFPSDSSWGTDENSFRLLNVNQTTVLIYDFIVMKVETSETEDDSFVVSELTDKVTKTVIDESPFRVLFNGIFKRKNRKVPTSLVTSFDFTNLYSSIVSYRVETQHSGTSELFQTLLRQSVEKPFETKWHVNLDQGPQDINFHNVAPFVELNSTHDRSLKLMFINPPGGESLMNIRINWSLTVKMLLIRFRLSIVAFTVGFVSLVMAYQFVHYGQSGHFIAFDCAVHRILKEHWIGIFTFLSLLTPLAAFIGLPQFAMLITNKTSGGSSSSLSNNTAFFLGTRETFMWWLGPFFFLMTVSLVYLVYRIVSVSESTVTWLFGNAKDGGEMTENSLGANGDTTSRNYDVRQALGLLIIIVSVIFYIPYQFAFVVLTIVQTLHCLKLAARPKGSKNADLANFNNSMLMLMLFLVPINAPIVVVFMRNFAIKWQTPFRSHHNFLAVLPIVLLIESNARSRMPRRLSSKRDFGSIAIVVWLLHISMYSILFGARNLYWLHHLFNCLCAMLFFKTLA
ncbi:LAFA_0A05600g1_1 [Lachancea sp. 'fantastica']|nr:LAFA_0A05600g1_1 [Lachancea sp. 'fantastica']